MMITDWITRRVGGSPVAGVATLLLWLAGGSAVAQIPLTLSHATVPDGYTLHESIDVGGRATNIFGSTDMYDTLVNLHSGARLQGETFELHALPDTKHTKVDYLKAFISGVGGDPYSFAKLEASKGKLYDFTGLFRRDRQFFDYNLLGNPNLPAGQTLPVGPTASPTGTYAWPQVMQSPFMFNTVRRMTDTALTLFPLSKWTFRAAYSQNVFQGPSLTPSGYQVASSYAVLLQENQRNSTDDWRASLEWKPWPQTRLSYEEQITHYKGDSYFSMAPQYLNLQEANGTRVALLQNYDNPVHSALTLTCGTGVGLDKIYPAVNNGLPIVDPACNVISSYTRTQPTRVLFPTEIFRMQSSSIPNVTMNGNVRYTYANMSLPNFYDNFQGLSGTTRQLQYVGNASAKREAIAADYGVSWRLAKKLTVSEQIDYSNVHQPGTANMTSYTKVTAGTASINSTALTTTVINTATSPLTSTFSGSPSVQAPQFNYFGQKFITNNVTATYDASDRTTFTLTYYYQKHTIGEGSANTTSYLTGIENFTINENGGTFGVSLRPTRQWNINGSVEVRYADNAFTPVAPRELQHYRIHTTYHPKPWASFSGAYNDIERHNNTNNTGAVSVDGPLQHVDHSRTVSFNADLMPGKHYALDVSYAYSDVYTSTNICYQGSASSATIPGAASPAGVACPSPTPRAGSPYTFGPVKDFMDAPTQYASVLLTVSPDDKLHVDLGYRLSSVNGSRFFNDPRDVNGSLVSTYQTPFAKLSYAMQKNLVWQAAFDYFGYGEGGRSGAMYCSASTTLPTLTTSATVVPCSTLANTAMSGPAYGFTAPRNFHADNLTVGVHYEF
ncbi:MAG: hypothetical protein P4M01_14040 [Acidobacteriota bacterium]|nr:hypothetical protein [Acidobacteriota bacterium]